MQIVLTCPLCDSERSQEYPFESTPYRICLDCDFVYQSPRMTDTQLQSFYGTDEYRKTRPAAYESTNIDEIPRARRVASWITTGKTHLDVGCARGYLLQFTRERGFVVAGVEPNPSYTFEDIPTVRRIENIDGEWDNITCIHVLEHVADVSGMASGMINLLAPGGTLIVEVPGEKSADGALSSAHLSYFKPHVLKRLFGSLRLVREMELPYTIMFFTKDVADAEGVEIMTNEMEVAII